MQHRWWTFYPSSQHDVIFQAAFSLALDFLPYGLRLDDPRCGIEVRAGVAYCPICGAVMDNPHIEMEFDYSPVYTLLCPVCSYEGFIA